jgi:5-hydroxyisourate hydrolase
MSTISTHVLDAGRGRPAAGVLVRLYAGEQLLGEAQTDDDGRAAGLTPERVEPGTYRLVFDLAEYDSESFFPEATVTFRVTDDRHHHHLPLLLSPFAYSTYRGS